MGIIAFIMAIVALLMYVKFKRNVRQLMRHTAFSSTGRHNRFGWIQPSAGYINTEEDPCFIS